MPRKIGDNRVVEWIQVILSAQYLFLIVVVTPVNIFFLNNVDEEQKLNDKHVIRSTSTDLSFMSL